MNKKFKSTFIYKSLLLEISLNELILAVLMAMPKFLRLDPIMARFEDKLTYLFKLKDNPKELFKL